MLNKRSLCRKIYDLDVNFCLYLTTDVHAALIRLFISVVSCCSNVMACPRYFAFSLFGKTSTLMSSIVASDCLLDLWLPRIFVLSGWIFSSTLSALLLKSFIILLSCSSDVENNSTSSANLKLNRQSVWWPPKLMPMPCLFSKIPTPCLFSPDLVLVLGFTPGTFAFPFALAIGCGGSRCPRRRWESQQLLPVLKGTLTATSTTASSSKSRSPRPVAYLVAEVCELFL